ncbi:DUF3017 domain-containing protein [Calidifontibacter sp. DB0510]|uniref:DUF3017 domain-containing protein n=1 Tax=Metallococcus carri TaxID=1656884 RepID=A0A967EHM6_9MICO|nr:DUF3017 domain-containing protein [Metallococcus carri]NHN56598.1 DUF3017 domain-containing protein [Metallococcus carri]NOP38897.1 DUF3017 domain-containing protein [Calidifontibacter sp. DB2511S]
MKSAELGHFWWLIASAAVVGVALIGVGQVRLGGYVVAAGLALGGLLRLAIPRRSAGAVALRSRMLDLVIYLGLAVAVFVAVSEVKL